MKPNVVLTITSLLSILLLTLHLTDDIVQGIAKGEPSNLIALPILVLLLYGTLVLGHRLVGHVIMLVGGILAAGMPVIHMRGQDMARSPRPAAASSSSGRLALGATGLFSIVLSAHGLCSLRRGQAPVVQTDLKAE